jgi:uncharacterized SAM-binding protein YcdF (DUF218 family)
MLKKDISLRIESYFQIPPTFFHTLKKNELAYLTTQLKLSSQEVEFLRSQLSVQNLDLTLQQKQDFQILINFLAQNELSTLTSIFLKTNYQINQADMILILGNPYLEVIEAAAQAFHQGLAKRILVAGGIGHGTIFLRKNIALNYNYADINTQHRSEAEIIKDALLVNRVPDNAVILETKSTNSGENAKNALTTIKNANIPLPRHVILMQDPALQKRAHATFLKQWNENNGIQCKFINCPGFVPNINNEKTKRFFSLIAGEMARIQPNAYGPNGKKFITHVNIPDAVQAAYVRLKPILTNFERE